MANEHMSLATEHLIPGNWPGIRVPQTMGGAAGRPHSDFSPFCPKMTRRTRFGPTKPSVCDAGAHHQQSYRTVPLGGVGAHHHHHHHHQRAALDAAPFAPPPHLDVRKRVPSMHGSEFSSQGSYGKQESQGEFWRVFEMPLRFGLERQRAPVDNKPLGRKTPKFCYRQKMMRNVCVISNFKKRRNAAKIKIASRDVFFGACAQHTAFHRRKRN